MIKQLTKTQTIIFTIGGIMMVAGAGLFVLQFAQLEYIAAVVFLIGALLFSLMQSMQSYQGKRLAIKRLKGIQNLAGLFFILAGILMIDKPSHFMSSMFSHWETYIQIVYNRWVVMMLIGVMLELYTTHRISSELKKEDGNENKDETENA